MEFMGLGDVKRKVEVTELRSLEDGAAARVVYMIAEVKDVSVSNKAVMSRIPKNVEYVFLAD